MTDNEIIKAFECCIKAETRNGCERLKCPACDDIACRFSDYSDNDFINVSRNLCERIFSCINRQKAEIAEIQKNSETLAIALVKAKAEIERLRNTVKTDFLTAREQFIVKEMTEDEEK